MNKFFTGLLVSSLVLPAAAIAAPDFTLGTGTHEVEYYYSQSDGTPGCIDPVTGKKNYTQITAYKKSTPAGGLASRAHEDDLIVHARTNVDCVSPSERRTFLHKHKIAGEGPNNPEPGGRPLDPVLAHHGEVAFGEHSVRLEEGAKEAIGVDSKLVE